MAIIQDYNPGTEVTAIVDPTFKALRTSITPPEYEGAFRCVQRSGTIAAATAAGLQYSFRYIGTGSCIILSVRLGNNITLGYTQGAQAYQMFVTRGYWNPDTVGTAAIIGNVQKLRSTMTQPQVEMRITATGNLTAATVGGIDDPQPIAAIQQDMPAIITNNPMKEFLNYGPYSKMLTLTQYEGFRIRSAAAYPATGTSVLTVQVEWLEYPAISTTFF